MEIGHGLLGCVWLAGIVLAVLLLEVARLHEGHWPISLSSIGIAEELALGWLEVRALSAAARLAVDRAGVRLLLGAGLELLLGGLGLVLVVDVCIRPDRVQLADLRQCLRPIWMVLGGAISSRWSAFFMRLEELSKLLSEYCSHLLLQAAAEQHMLDLPVVSRQHHGVLVLVELVLLLQLIDLLDVLTHQVVHVILLLLIVDDLDVEILGPLHQVLAFLLCFVIDFLEAVGLPFQRLLFFFKFMDFVHGSQAPITISIGCVVDFFFQFSFDDLFS